MCGSKFENFDKMEKVTEKYLQRDTQNVIEGINSPLIVKEIEVDDLKFYR